MPRSQRALFADLPHHWLTAIAQLLGHVGHAIQHFGLHLSELLRKLRVECCRHSLQNPCKLVLHNGSPGGAFHRHRERARGEAVGLLANARFRNLAALPCNAYSTLLSDLIQGQLLRTRTR